MVVLGVQVGLVGSLKCKQAVAKNRLSLLGDAQVEGCGVEERNTYNSA